MIQILKSALSIILPALIIFGPLPSSAQVHYSDLIPDEVIQLSVPWPTLCNSDQYGVDVNLDNTVDFILNAKYGNYGGYPDTAIISIKSASSSDYFVGHDFVDTLNVNDIIDASLKWVKGEKILLKRDFYLGNYYGNWTIDTEHFVGLKVVKGSSAYYGWLRMVVTEGSAKAILKDFACQLLAEKSILAGQGLDNFAVNIQVTDVGDQKNGTDVKVDFDPAYNEEGMVEYRIMTVNAEQAANFTLDSANAVTEDHYMSVPADGTSHSLQLASTAMSTDGMLITNGINYSIFILSCYENTMDNILSYPVPILLQTQTTAATNVVCLDNGNAGNGIDVTVSFDKVSNEDRISEYRIMVVPAQEAETFDLEAADQVGQGYYTSVIPVDSNIFVSLDPQSTDITGDPIVEEIGYYIFILSVADGVLADKNALSEPSNLFILSIPSYLYAGQTDMSYIHHIDVEPDIELSSWDQQSFTLDLNGDGAEDYDFICYYGGSVGSGAMGSIIEGSHQNKKIITSLNSTWIKKSTSESPLHFSME